MSDKLHSCKKIKVDNNKLYYKKKIRAFPTYNCPLMQKVLKSQTIWKVLPISRNWVLDIMITIQY